MSLWDPVLPDANRIADEMRRVWNTGHDAKQRQGAGGGAEREARQQQGLGAGRGWEDVAEGWGEAGHVVGVGGSSVVEVWRHRTEEGRVAASKRIAKADLRCAEDVLDVRAEVQALLLLRGHPHVVVLEEVWEDSCAVHLVMEMCSGGNLRHSLAACHGGALEEADAAAVFAQLLSALAHAHRHGVVHRDVKLENILLLRPPSRDSMGGSGCDTTTAATAANSNTAAANGSEDTTIAGASRSSSSNSSSSSGTLRGSQCDCGCCGNSRWHVKLADFGLARVLQPTPSPAAGVRASSPAHTGGAAAAGARAHGMAGSPFYMAPEVAAAASARRGYDSKVDLWSAGVVLFCLLSGSMPFGPQQRPRRRRRPQTSTGEDRGSYARCTSDGQVELKEGVAGQEEFWSEEELVADGGRQDLRAEDVVRHVQRSVRRGLKLDKQPWQRISADAKALVQQLLSVNPAARPSAEELLASDPWLARHRHHHHHRHHQQQKQQQPPLQQLQAPLIYSRGDGDKAEATLARADHATADSQQPPKQPENVTALPGDDQGTTTTSLSASVAGSGAVPPTAATERMPLTTTKARTQLTMSNSSPVKFGGRGSRAVTGQRAMRRSMSSGRALCSTPYWDAVLFRSATSPTCPQPPISQAVAQPQPSAAAAAASRCVVGTDSCLHANPHRAAQDSVIPRWCTREVSLCGSRQRLPCGNQPVPAKRAPHAHGSQLDWGHVPPLPPAPRACSAGSIWFGLRRSRSDRERPLSPAPSAAPCACGDDAWQSSPAVHEHSRTLPMLLAPSLTAT